MNSHLFTLKDQEVGGTLVSKLRRWRKQGKSFVQISKELGESGTPVHRATVGNWLRELNIR